MRALALQTMTLRHTQSYTPRLTHHTPSTLAVYTAAWSGLVSFLLYYY
jgi:hypothetical protein